MTEAEIQFMKEDMKKESTQGFGRWGWFGVTYHLAKTFHKTFEEISDWNFILCLNILSYEREQEMEINKNKSEQTTK